MLEKLQRELAELREENARLLTKNTTLESEKQSLLQTIDFLRRQIFGRRSERFHHDPDQHLLFEASIIDLEAEDDRYRARSKRNGRKPLPEDLEREEIVLDLPDEDKTCPHGHPRQRFGEDVTEELEVIPARLKVIRYVRPKYKTSSCPHRECAGVTTASLPARPIEQGRAGPGLLAHVAVSKYGDHLPLYRQAQIFERQGIDLNRSTLCDWLTRTGELLRPIVESMKRDIFNTRYIQADETPIRVLKVKKGKAKQGYLWGYGIPWGEVVYDFSLDRSQKNPHRFLRGYEGCLQIDGYDGYNAVFKGGRVVRLGCFAHMRRKFHAALKESPEEAKAALAAIQLLYRMEREMKEEGIGPEEKLVRRKERSLPILDDLKNLLTAYRTQALPGGLLGKAITYAFNEWPYLVRVFEVGESEIDNNGIEHTMRPVAVGRKNYLFAGSPRGGHMAAVLYSLVTSCKRMKINPWEYLRDVIDRVSTHPMSRIEELTPKGWKPAQKRSLQAAGAN